MIEYQLFRFLSGSIANTKCFTDLIVEDQGSDFDRLSERRILWRRRVNERGVRREKRCASVTNRVKASAQKSESHSSQR